VRQLDASSNAGLHRTPWDLRETAPAVPAGGRGGEQEGATAGGRGGRGGLVRSGPPVKTGSYEVTLGKLVNGTITSVGKAVTVEVVPLEK
jgi:hypothetical protein